MKPGTDKAGVHGVEIYNINHETGFPDVLAYSQELNHKYVFNSYTPLNDNRFLDRENFLVRSDPEGKHVMVSMAKDTNKKKSDPHDYYDELSSILYISFCH